MNKTQTTFECSKCGSQYPKWTGRCSECGTWGTVGEPKVTEPQKKIDESAAPADVLDFSQVQAKDIARINFFIVGSVQKHSILLPMILILSPILNRILEIILRGFYTPERGNSGSL